MRYNVFASNSIPLMVEWKCSNCNTMNSTVFHVENKAYASTKSRKTADHLQATSSQTLAEMGQEKIGDILREAKHNRYRIAEFNCGCSNCSHKEPWAKMRYSKAEDLILSIYIFIAIILFVYFIFALQDGLDKVFFLHLLIALPLIGWFVFKWIHRRIMERKIRNLDTSSLPKISFYRGSTK